MDRRAEVIEDLVECRKRSVVRPAVDVCCLHFEGFFTQSFRDKLRDTGLPGPAGSGDHGSLGGFTVCDWFEDAGEVVDLGVAMLDFLRDESGAEDAIITDYLLPADFCQPSYKSVTKNFPRK